MPDITPDYLKRFEFVKKNLNQPLIPKSNFSIGKKKEDVNGNFEAGKWKLEVRYGSWKLDIDRYKNRLIK
ncbi:MAG: hypothetical protein Q8P29_00295 [Candidatus Levybacteria bacterium]|nr:hypothetical protein [Candidatus Levybacteria bacterium]